MKPTIHTPCPRCGAAIDEGCTTPQGRACDLHAVRVPTLPKVGDLILVEFGSGGTQLARVVYETKSVGEPLFVEKWRDHSRRWTKTARVPWSRHRGVPSSKDARVKRALEPAMEKT